MSIKFISVPSKRLAQTINATDYSFVLDNIKGWSGTNLSASDFGSELYVSFRNSANTKVEFMKVDPATIADSSITILKRGLAYNGEQATEVPANIQDVWVKGDTIVELGSHVPQLLQETMLVSGDQTVAGKKTFSTVPATTGGNAVAGTDLVPYSQALALLTGSATTDRIVVAGTAGETVAAGNLCYLKESDGRWWKADADSASSAENVILGFAQGSGTAGNPVSSGVLLWGVDSNQTGLTANSIYYVSNTAGAISLTVGTKEVTAGFSLSTTSILFNPRYNQQLTEDQQDAAAGAGATAPSVSNKFVTNSMIPAGVIMPYAGSSTPTDWLLCDGTAVNRTTYATLFAVISTTYGVGDGSTTFNVPDLRGRMVIGSGAGSKVATFASRSSNTITVTGLSNVSTNEFQTGQAVTYSTSGSVITGLTNNTVYYINRVSNSSFQLSTTRANSIAGTVISLSSDGTGTQTFTLALTTKTSGETGGEEEHSLLVSELPSHSHSLSENVWASGTGYGAISPGGAVYELKAVTASAAGSSTSHNNLSPYLAVNYIIKAI